ASVQKDEAAPAAPPAPAPLVRATLKKSKKVKPKVKQKVTQPAATRAPSGWRIDPTWHRAVLLAQTRRRIPGEPSGATTASATAVAPHSRVDMQVSARDIGGIFA